MDESEKRRRKRVRQAYERLGTSMPACSICGENDPFCLERHEPGGRRYNEMSVIVCRNCHRKLSNRQRDHHPPEWTPPDELERISHALLGEADLLSALATKRRADAGVLIKLSRKGAVGSGREDDAGN
jgi:hypothetical protein